MGVCPVDPSSQALDNAQWGSIPLPRTQLKGGVEAEIELSAPAGTEYHAVGLRHGPWMPGVYNEWPEAEKNNGSSWIGWDERPDLNTGHLNFFFHLVP